MVNSVDFANRLQKILEYYDLSAAAFADTIDVGRSSISHILSGRNKPSLDFVLRIVHAFPEVELYWLLNGKGSFPHVPQENEKVETRKPAEAPLSEEKEKLIEKAPSLPAAEVGKIKTIDKIVIFYKDGSFQAFEN